MTCLELYKIYIYISYDILWPLQNVISIYIYIIMSLPQYDYILNDTHIC